MTGPQWVSQREAADVLGCSVATVARLARAGELVTRSTAGGTRMSVNARSVRVYLLTRDRRAARRRRKRARRRPGPRPRGHALIDEAVHLDAEVAALVLGVTRARVNQAVLRGRLPYITQRRKRWFRREVIEHLAARRALIRTSAGDSVEARRHGLWWPVDTPE